MKNNVKTKCMQKIWTKDLPFYANGGCDCAKYNERKYREEFDFYELRFFKRKTPERSLKRERIIEKSISDKVRVLMRREAK